MRNTLAVFTFAVVVAAVTASAQDRAPAAAPSEGRDRSPPAQAYADCAGKQAGASVQHTTPEGKVPAICTDSSKGLVARPVRPREAASGGSPAKPPGEAAPPGASGSDRGRQ